MTKELIEAGALRQLKHNDGSEGFVVAYDKDIVDREFARINAIAAPTDEARPVAEVLMIDGVKTVDASMEFLDSADVGTQLFTRATSAAASPSLPDPEMQKLKELAQKASPGPWKAKNGFGAGLEIYMSHPQYPDKDWPAFGTDSAWCKKGLVAYETWVQFPNDVRDAAQARNAEFIAAANPATILSLIARLEGAAHPVQQQEQGNA